MILKYDDTKSGKGLFENKVNIIAAFPSTGKTTATALLANDMNYVIRDIDSAEFRANLKKKAGPIDVDTNWFVYYVDYIQSMVGFYQNELDLNPEYAGKTVILFVSSHKEVRDTMTKREMKYFYTVPTVNMFRKFILPAAAARVDAAKKLKELDTAGKLDHEEKIGSVTRAYEFLAQNGEKMINGVTEETASNVYEQLIWLGTDITSDNVEDDDDDEPDYLYYFIHRNTYVGDELTNITWKSERIYMDHLTDVAMGLINHPGMFCAFLTPRGELAIISPRMKLESLAMVFDTAGIDFATAANFANYKSDHLVISRSDAQDLYQILEDIVTESGKSDYELWGDKSRAFECLYDNLKGYIYKMGLNLRELNEAKLNGDDYSDVYDFDSDTEPAFADRKSNESEEPIAEASEPEANDPNGEEDNNG